MTPRSALAAGVALAALLAAGCGGGSSQPPAFAFLVVEPAAVHAGEAATLRWSVTGATTVAVEGVGYATGSSVTVHPFETSRFRVTATGPGGATSATATVLVDSSLDAPTISSFTASPANVLPGGASVLSWSVGGATSISISGLGPVTGSSVTVSPGASTTYQLSATSPAGTSTSRLVVWTEPAPDPALLREVAGAVSAARLEQFVREASGAVPVTVGGQPITITERFSPAGKARFRAYWTQAFAGLGLSVETIDYPTGHSRSTGESSGRHLEAVLPGASPDSIVLITHYDSSGSPGLEAANPGADDNMTGMAQILEAARILQAYPGRRHYTVRLVAADYEEFFGLEGATQYAWYLDDLARRQGFRIVAAIDPEQSGWNCATDGSCPAAEGGHFVAITACDVGIGAAPDFPLFDYLALEERFGAAAAVTSLEVRRACNGNVSDHFPFAVLGVPSVMYSELWPIRNPFRDMAGDTVDTLDFAYHAEIARVGIAALADLVGITPPP